MFDLDMVLAVIVVLGDADVVPGSVDPVVTGVTGDQIDEGSVIKLLENNFEGFYNFHIIV